MTKELNFSLKELESLLCMIDETYDRLTEHRETLISLGAHLHLASYHLKNALQTIDDNPDLFKNNYTEEKEMEDDGRVA